ncbi:hypothetical protein B0H10DRAFT_2001868 [Mycena sp. CBHHK59/15]|nr:hypothetical protein B0H10DRAFT_2001868 [Mycena sp. CBHHK59/15]
MSSERFKTDFKTTVKQEEDYLRRVYPGTKDIPSCTNHLDSYFACNAIRNLVRSMYRYGYAREDCSEKWQEYKFCLSLKWMEVDERRDAWIRRKAIWWAKRRLGKSSEDVWQVREQPLQSYPKPVDPMEYLRERPQEYM